MYILDTLSDIGYYRTALAFKSLAKIVFIVVPLMIMILCIINVITITFKPDEAKTQIKTVVDRVIAGLIIFILPSVINYGLSLVKGYDNSKILKYYEGASKQKIEQLQIQYKQEQVAARNKEEAEYKEASKKIAQEEKKRRATFEEIRKEWEEQHNPSTNSNSGGSGGSNSSGGGSNYSGGPSVTNPGDSISSGSYGSVTVNNGVFTIPNRRATSDADIPKQSGQYGLNPIFWERLNKFIQAAKQNGYKITVTSGWRSYSSQRRLWDNSNRSCSTRSKWVACPGGSRHGFGIAADLKFNGSSCSGGSWNCNAAARWAHENAGKYGLKFRMSWEPWHIEPSQVKGGSFGSCKASC